MLRNLTITEYRCGWLFGRSHQAVMGFWVAAFLLLSLPSHAILVRLETNWPFGGNRNIDIQLFPEVAPNTVNNFLYYVENDLYDFSLIHRSVPGFVLQTGAFTNFENFLGSIPTIDPVANEFQLSNTAGTIAMAKIGGDPDSATSSFFFNMGDNSSNLDNQNGGFTVFGQVISGFDLVQALNNSGPFNSNIFQYQQWFNSPNFPDPPSKFSVASETPLAYVTDQFGNQFYYEFVILDAFIIPEPATITLTLLGGFLVLKRKNSRPIRSLLKNQD